MALALPLFKAVWSFKQYLVQSKDPDHCLCFPAGETQAQPPKAPGNPVPWNRRDLPIITWSYLLSPRRTEGVTKNSSPVCTSLVTTGHLVPSPGEIHLPWARFMQYPPWNLPDSLKAQGISIWIWFTQCLQLRGTTTTTKKSFPC